MSATLCKEVKRYKEKYVQVGAHRDVFIKYLCKIESDPLKFCPNKRNCCRGILSRLSSLVYFKYMVLPDIKEDRNIYMLRSKKHDNLFF